MSKFVSVLREKTCRAPGGDWDIHEKACEGGRHALYFRDLLS